MNERDIAFLPAWELGRLIKAKEISPVELTELYIRRIEEFNPALNAFITIAADYAIRDAKMAEAKIVANDISGSFFGVPIGIKDLELTSGIRSTMGSLVYENYIPDRDTAVVERIRNSGQIILGKTNTPEFGLSGTTENRLSEACRNPWNLERTSGGSSGGSGSAVAAGLCSLTTGSDGGGSIRIPSSYCGIYGIKPTLGRIPRFGGLGQRSPNLTSQAGPMTRTVRDAALLLGVLSGFDKRDPYSLKDVPAKFADCLDKEIKGIKIAWSSDLGYAAVDRETLDVTRSAATIFEDLGADVDEPVFCLEHPMETFLNIFAANNYASYGELIDTSNDMLTEYGKQNLELGRKVTTVDYARALLSVQIMKAKIDELMDTYDLLMTPTMAIPAFPVNEQPKYIDGQSVHPRWGYLPFTPVFNLTGQPAANVPCGFSHDGMPIGLHIVGRRGEESLVLRASYAFEKAKPWINLRPPVS